MSDGPQVGLQVREMTKEEEAIAHSVWPCLQCGRFEHEACNGNRCPHGRKVHSRYLDDCIARFGEEKGRSVYEGVRKVTRPMYPLASTKV